ncbi:PREDICTED: uncharacterized protein LOC109212124 [Nicotiana attenuata]|uniref:uncharacterized protein LOC109212124 n=1 Tax=Nicotiana attenuata TaxID=49451 RepID=UPI000905A042|nr:PREDICTED: uncharacterized protein LOC109212124 [Nicotiana attenuata]
MVQWEFIEEMLKGYGFPPKFIQMIMACLTTKFSVKVNGEGYGYFEGKRGLRQGLSPLLFVMVIEYLSRILKRMSQLPDFKYHPMCKEQQLTHLTFADDLMLFCKGNEAVVRRITEALRHFSETTGLKANTDKSSIYIAGVDDELKQKLLDITCYSSGTFPMRYLGLTLSPKRWSKMDYH